MNNFKENAKDFIEVFPMMLDDRYDLIRMYQLILIVILFMEIVSIYVK